ncbi:hypothetical protein SDC9_178331 [bioreactor metagenome]|uniref:Uncharacterized protein n=1 Tax=bioreactor metagenome TaxID=1076179 RepID=A0A645GWX3_9ZZZZ
MCAVTVFAFQIVRNDHIRLKPADQAGQFPRRLLLAPVYKREPKRLGIHVFEGQKHRRMSHPCVPKSV